MILKALGRLARPREHDDGQCRVLAGEPLEQPGTGARGEEPGRNPDQQQRRGFAADARDGEVVAERFGMRAALRAARWIAGAGVALGLAAPAEILPLAAIPLTTLVVLLSFRPSERYGLFVVDGALVAGALLSVAFTVR